MTEASKKEFGTGPAAEVRRWLKELDLADKMEKDWRTVGDKIWDVYRGTKRRKNSFNILWSNTETLAPALFNTPPSPDVRRRFRDEDPVGKAVAQLLERCLEFQTDTEGFMHSIKQDVLDAILPGRGVSRVKYVPEFAPAPGAVEQDAESAETTETVDGEPVEPDEVLAFEQCQVEHVQWDDFRHGPGKTWREVQWVAFRHRMTKDEIADLAGEQIAAAITFDNCQDDGIDKDSELKTVFGTTEVWEFWCKEYRQVKYISKAYLNDALKTIDDPLKLIDFFPNPRPLYAIQDSSSLVPSPLFEQYREQANELDALSSRINRLVNALKVRGIYDSTIAEMGQLMLADDNKLIPTQNAAMWLDKGGLEKSIYWMPIEQAAKVLKELYVSRDAAKQVIYELSGIADVRRGTSDPGETLGAQKLKADFGNQRISGLKLEVERYVRDLMRLMSELIAEKFQPESLLRMSQMQIPTEAEIQQKVAQTQAQAAQSVPPGQDPQQAIAQAMQQLGKRPTSLEQVMAVLKDDATRMFKIDVETDSMVAATVNDDMQGLQQVLSGVVQFIEGVGPAVQAGAFPVEAVKEIVMTICRRSKMGSAVEDALDKIQAPQQQSNPEQMKAQAAAQAAQVKAQSDAQAVQIKAQVDTQTAQIKAQSDAQIAQIQAHAQQQTDIVRQQAEAAQHQAKIDNEARLAQMKQMFDDQQAMRDMEFQRWKAELDSATKIEVANQVAKNRAPDAATEAATGEIAREIQ
jgi:hypothetical protein